MIAIKVQYTVRPDFAEENQANIRNVMTALQTDPIEGLKYAAFIHQDAQTFTHQVIARDEATRLRLVETAEFKAFQQALQGSQPVTPPSADSLELVGASFEI